MGKQEKLDATALRLAAILRRRSDTLGKEWDAGERSAVIGLETLQETLLAIADELDPPRNTRS